MLCTCSFWNNFNSHKPRKRDEWLNFSAVNTLHVANKNMKHTSEWQLQKLKMHLIYLNLFITVFTTPLAKQDSQWDHKQYHPPVVYYNVTYTDASFVFNIYLYTTQLDTCIIRFVFDLILKIFPVVSKQCYPHMHHTLLFVNYYMLCQLCLCKTCTAIPTYITLVHRY